MTIENKIIVSGLIPTTVVGILFSLGSAFFTDAQAGYSALGGMVLTLVFIGERTAKLSNPKINIR